MYKLVFLFSIVFATSNCEKTPEKTPEKTQEKSNQEIKTIYIGATLVDCIGVGPQKCMLYRESPEEEWSYFYDSIAGFTYESGFLYELKVGVSTVAEPMADASSLTYTLLKILKKEQHLGLVKNATQTHAKITAITYEETSRGYQKKIAITPAQISLFKNHSTEAVASKVCPPDHWEQLIEQCHTFAITELSKWEAPTQKRHYDGAPHSQLVITTSDSIYTSTSFDAGAPPPKLEGLTSQIIELSKSLDME